MKKIGLLILIIFILAFNFTACTNKSHTSDNNKVEESFYKSGTNDTNYVELYKVTDNIWVHTTYTDYEGMRTPSNGVIAVTSKGLILIDTPWNSTQTTELIELSKKLFKKDISLAIITHAHDDRIGGIDVLLEKKIDVRSTDMTMKEAEKNGFKKPKTLLKEDEKITLGDIDIEVFYPGEGHTSDNITIWFPRYKVLFGGCLIKSLESKDIGSITDANIKQWPDSVNKVIKKYSNAKIVIPGHGKWGDLKLAEHTLDLLKK